MKRRIAWTTRLPDRVKRETRVHVTFGGLKWQFKRSDEERWDYSSAPTSDDWDMLEDILQRRAHRGHAIALLPAVRTMRERAGC